MRVWKYLAAAGIGLLCCSWHPLKMSYTAVKYDPAERCLQVSFRVFQDDVEAAFLRNYGYSCNIARQSGDSVMLDYLVAYFDQAFDLQAGNEEICFYYQRMQPEQQMGLVLYFKSRPVPVGQLASLQIFNAILTTTFSQQVNMLFVGLGADHRYTEQMDLEVQEVSINF